MFRTAPPIGGLSCFNILQTDRDMLIFFYFWQFANHQLVGFLLLLPSRANGYHHHTKNQLFGDSVHVVCSWITCRLYELFPHLVHVEEDTLIKPHYTQMEMLFGTQIYDWSRQYTCHVWTRDDRWKVPENPTVIRNLNSTLGQMMRHIYYGQTSLVDGWPEPKCILWCCLKRCLVKKKSSIWSWQWSKDVNNESIVRLRKDG